MVIVKSQGGSRNLTLIVCGAPLTARTPDLLRVLASEDWSVSVVATQSAQPWLDADAVLDLTGAPPRVNFQDPRLPRRTGSPQGVVVCPATFNTINKVALGIADTYASAQLCSALGEGLPLLVVPMVNNKLWGHPAWARSLAVLEEAGVTLLDIHTGTPGPVAVESGNGDKVVAGFDPGWVINQLR